MRPAVAVLPVLPLLLLTRAADAGWSAVATGSADVAADTVTNAAGFTAACAASKANSPVSLSWTPSPDPYVEGYEVVRTGTGGGTNATFFVPRGATTMTDTPPTGKGIAYTYTIQARSTTNLWVSSVAPATGTPTYRPTCSTL